MAMFRRLRGAGEIVTSGHAERSGADLVSSALQCPTMSRDQPHLIGITCRRGESWSGEDRMHCGPVT